MLTIAPTAAEVTAAERGNPIVTHHIARPFFLGNQLEITFRFAIYANAMPPTVEAARQTKYTAMLFVLPQKKQATAVITRETVHVFKGFNI